MQIDTRVADLRKKAALLRAQAHLLEEEARQIEDAAHPKKNHVITPQAGTFTLRDE